MDAVSIQKRLCIQFSTQDRLGTSTLPEACTNDSVRTLKSHVGISVMHRELQISARHDRICGCAKVRSFAHQQERRCCLCQKSSKSHGRHWLSFFFFFENASAWCSSSEATVANHADATGVEAHLCRCHALSTGAPTQARRGFPIPVVAGWVIQNQTTHVFIRENARDVLSQNLNTRMPPELHGEALKSK